MVLCFYLSDLVMNDYEKNPNGGGFFRHSIGCPET
jgi:hypothetical protein